MQSNVPIKIFAPAKSLVPAIFLFLLGMGNITVGVLKERQYREVYEELAVLQTAPNPISASSLGRIRAAVPNRDRHLERQGEATERRNFYSLVIFGGKVFIVASLPLFVFAALTQYRANRFL